MVGCPFMPKSNGNADIPTGLDDVSERLTHRRAHPGYESGWRDERLCAYSWYD
jgi:hypothetical protein